MHDLWEKISILFYRLYIPPTIYSLRKLNVLFRLMFHDFKNSIALSNCLFFWQEQKADGVQGICAMIVTGESQSTQ
jgi:hypothetical protein